MTYDTNNPLGSVDVRDLYDNAQNADNFSNGPLDAYPDRFGVSRQSLQGIRNASQYVDLGPYGPGLNFTSRNQVFSYLGNFYSPGPAITLPYTTTGSGAGEIANFRNVGDAILRSDLADDTDPAKGVGLVGGATRSLSTVAALREWPGGVGDQVRVDSYSPLSENGGGGFWWDSTSTEADNGGTIFAVTGVVTGRWKRIFTRPLEFDAVDFGVVGNANFRDAVSGKFWVDNAKTLVPADDTAALQRLFAAAQGLPVGAGKTWINLNGLNCYTLTALLLSKSYVGIKNGRIKQGSETEDVLQIGGPQLLMYNTLDGVSLHKCHSTPASGSLLHLLTNGVGNFVWDCNGDINEGGLYGLRMYGSSFMMDINRVWVNDTYSSGFYMPGAGGTTQPPVQLGGSTTTTLLRPYVTNVRTLAPAFDIGTGYDGITMISPAADHITQFGRFKVNGLNIVGIGYSENIRKPIEGAPLVDHKFLEIQNAAPFHIDGFYASLAADFGASPSGVKAFLDCDFIVGSIGGVRGAFPADYAFIRTQGGNIEYVNKLNSVGDNLELFGGRALEKFRSALKFSGVYSGAGDENLFTIPGMAAASEAHTYLVTKTYSFAGVYVSDTWLVSGGNGKSVVTRLQTGPDYAAGMTLAVTAAGVVVLGNTTPATLSGPWAAVEFNSPHQ